MGIFKRFSDIISANLNDLTEGFEDPERWWPGAHAHAGSRFGQHFGDGKPESTVVRDTCDEGAATR